MQLGMVGLGRMGNYMVQRLMRDGHECVVYDARPESVADLVGKGAVGSASLEEFVSKLSRPRAVWLMLPAAITDKVIAQLLPLLHDDDHDLWALGPATAMGRALSSAEAADPELIDRAGNTFRLSTLRGRKVVLTAWASY